ncbi:hypothetical protein K438DRAFT_1754320 [Mycena galopus ATCC 62051]|nr:hypothetical protein K438DRAFT_1754320 [Mycena galopus ATCC 62051]
MTFECLRQLGQALRDKNLWGHWINVLSTSSTRLFLKSIICNRGEVQVEHATMREKARLRSARLYTAWRDKASVPQSRHKVRLRSERVYTASQENTVRVELPLFDSGTGQIKYSIAIFRSSHITENGDKNNIPQRRGQARLRSERVYTASKKSVKRVELSLSDSVTSHIGA